MRLNELIEGLPIRVIAGDPERVRITDLTEDSRTVVPGSLFIARRGLTSDGTRFIASAIDAGAAAVLVDDADVPADKAPAFLVADDARLMTALLAERLHGSPSRRLLVAGVTGTNGKSTVAHLVHGLLNRSGVRCGLIGTVGIDDGTEFAPSSMTTPPATEISRTLATMVDAGCDAAVMEVSSHALDQRRADGIAFDCGIFTNISGDHADYHPSFEHYFAAKRRLLEMLGDNSAAVLNTDDPRVASTRPAVASGRVFSCSLVTNEDEWPDQDPEPGVWRVSRTASTIEGEHLRFAFGAHRIEATLPLIGSFNAMNACQSLATAWHLLELAGISEADRVDKLTSALSLAAAPSGRLEPVHDSIDDPAVFVDYAHTDDALARALDALRGVHTGELTVVFGCGGDRDRDKRPRMGEAAATRADRVFLTSDNPRSEPPASIIDEILEGIDASDRDAIVIHVDRGRAIEEAILTSPPGSAVLIAGKGHETDQVSADAEGNLVRAEFVDQEVARRALKKRRAVSEAERHAR